MKIKNLHKQEAGIAHLGLILLVVIVLAVGFFAYTRVNEANKSEGSDSGAVVEESEEVKDAEALNAADEEAQNTPDEVNDQEETENVTP